MKLIKEVINETIFLSPLVGRPCEQVELGNYSSRSLVVCEGNLSPEHPRPFHHW